jgi:cell volume regulation protein A
MEMTVIFGSIAALLLIAVIANWLSGLTHVPDLIVLLIIGVVLGPVLHWVDASRFRGAVEVLGTLALILILFQGGLEVRLREAMRQLTPALILALLTYALSLGLLAVAGRFSLGLTWVDAMLIGAALASTSGSIVLPALERIDSLESIKLTLTMESAVGEILAVLMVGSIIGVGGEQSMLTGLATGFTRSIGAAMALAIAAAFFWSKLWPRFANMPFSSVLNLGAVFGVYSAARYLAGSGLLAVLVFGVTLANLPRTPHMSRQGLRMVAFPAELTFLVRSFFFVLLGIVAEFVGRNYIIPIIAILAAIVLARYLGVLGSAWMIHDANTRQKELLFWMLPRGLVTAVLALEIVSARGPVFGFLPAVAFTVVLVTNAFVVWGAVRCGATLIAQEPFTPHRGMLVPPLAARREKESHAKATGAGGDSV